LALALAVSCGARTPGAVFFSDGGSDDRRDGAGPDAGLVCTAPGGSQPGAGWPFFRGYTDRTGTTGQPGPQQGTIAWFHDTGAPGVFFSSPVVSSQGVIYVATDGMDQEIESASLLAILPDGSRDWSYVLGSNYCWCSAAIAGDGMIVIGTGGSVPDEGEAFLVGVSAAGLLLWRTPLGGGQTSSPAIDDQGNIYVGVVTEGTGPGDRGSRLYALGPDGSISWSLDLEDWMDGSPALDRGCTIYVGTMHLWRVDTGPPMVHSAPNLGTPVIGRDGTIYLAANSGALYAVTPDGHILWEHRHGEDKHTVPALVGGSADGADDVLYTTAYRWDPPTGTLEALSALGEVVWDHPLEDIAASPPVVGSDGTIYMATRHGTVHAFQPDGSILWTQQLEGKVYGSPALANGRLYLGVAWDDTADGVPGGVIAIGP
jgi:hypothetical protein